MFAYTNTQLSNRVKNYFNDRIFSLEFIDFNTTIPQPPHITGRLNWNIDDHTLEIATEIDGVRLQIGQEQFLRVKNDEGDVINNGKVVYVSGSSGNNPQVKLANNLSPNTAITTAGLATHIINSNNNGYINTFGLVGGVNTNDWNEGDILWLDSSDGNLTNIRPVAPKYNYAIGTVVRKHSVNGIIFNKPTIVPRLSWLSDVSARGSEINGDLLSWNADISVWELKPYYISFGTPDSSSYVGTQGDLKVDNSYLYVCTSTNKWGRILLDFNF